MLDRRFFAELAAIVAASVICAVAANAIASRERKLALVGNYPKALTVTQRAEGPGTVSLTLPAGQEPVAVETATTAAPTTTGPAPATTPAPSTTAPVTSQPAPKPAPAQPARVAKTYPPHPDRPWVEIHYDDARVLYDRKALFIDARRSNVFEQGHIAGAKSMAVWEADVDEQVGQMAMAGLDGDAPIVVYCSGGNCEDSHMLAEKLFGVGFNNVLVYKEGYPDWQQRGGPVATGAAR